VLKLALRAEQVRCYRELLVLDILLLPETGGVLIKADAASYGRRCNDHLPADQMMVVTLLQRMNPLFDPSALRNAIGVSKRQYLTGCDSCSSVAC